MTQPNYIAGLMSETCWIIEFKDYLRLVKSGETQKNIRAEIVQNNFFCVPNEHRAASVAELDKSDNITTDVLLRICEALDCTIDDILDTIKDE